MAVLLLNSKFIKNVILNIYLCEMEYLSMTKQSVQKLQIYLYLEMNNKAI